MKPRHWIIGTRRFETRLWFHSQVPAYPPEITRTNVKIRQGEKNKDTVGWRILAADTATIRL